MIKKIIVVPFMKPAGMALFPFILINNKLLLKDETLIRHETIHLEQQLELLVIPFYITYLLNYLVNLIILKSHSKAYMAIAFEREAYRYELDKDYLKIRKRYAWLRFLKS